MTKSARRRPRPATAAIRPADAAAREQWVHRARTLLVGTAVALIVATPLIPSEAPALGSHVILIMAWLVLTAAWLMRSLLEAKPLWHVGPVGAAVGLFLALHSVSALVMMRYGHGRPTLNMLWQWVAFGLTFLAVRQLIRSAVQQRALVSVLIAMAVGMSTFGLYQPPYIYPENRARYEANPDLELKRAGQFDAPYGSPQRRHFEDRLSSTEPIGPFALTNSLAGVLAPCLVLLAGLSVPVWRSLFGANSGGSIPKAIGVLLGAGILLTCLILTKSRAGYLASLVGLGLLVTSNAFPRSRLPARWLASGIVSLAVVGVLVALFGGLDRQVLTEAPKSVLYRIQYWQATSAMIKDHPWWGCGPGNFKDYYTHYKLPEASETIADPHNFLMEVGATAGLPALGSLILVGAVLAWRVDRCRVQTTEGPAQNAGSPAARPVYYGAAAGFLFAYPAGWAGGQYPMPDMLWTALPAMLVSMWLLKPWVTHGTLPVVPLLAAIGTLLINLLAAGGISFPGVTGLLWVLVALSLNAADANTRDIVPTQSSFATGAISNRTVIGLAAGVALLLVIFAYTTMYRPVLAGHEYTTVLNEIRAKAATTEMDLQQLARQSLQAAEIDRWWSEPCDARADALHGLWITQPTRERLQEFDAALAIAQERNPQSAAAAAIQGRWLLNMYEASARSDLLDRSVSAYSRAVELYPNNSAFHAQLAWACYLAGDDRRAMNEAGEALRLDELMPHEELKLECQSLSGPKARRVIGGGMPPVVGGNAEQMMRDIRKSISE